jgi:hypothetical protein
MPVNQTLWRISDSIEKIKQTSLDSEQQLEDMLEKHIDIIDENWLVIGRQVLTSFNHYIDLLAITVTGEIIIIELKKDKTPREVVAQGLDYASWIQNLEPEDFANIFEKYDEKYMKSGQSLDYHFNKKFNIKLEEEEINNTHQIVIVASELDTSSERIIKYLNDSTIPINIIFFSVFEDKGNTYLSRAWMVDPYDISNITKTIKSKEPWNGEYYVSFGHSETRSWEDAMQYGFISGGGGLWYSRTLYQLTVGDKVWVNIPHTGFVGVGKVSDTVKKADEVIISDGKTIFELSKKANYQSEYKNDEDKAEYMVRIEWIHKVALNRAVSEVGFFGNQNTVCKPTTPKWNHTINRLKEVWGMK